MKGPLVGPKCAQHQWTWPEAASSSPLLALAWHQLWGGGGGRSLGFPCFPDLWEERKGGKESRRRFCPPGTVVRLHTLCVRQARIMIPELFADGRFWRRRLLFLSCSTFVGVLGAPVKLPISHSLCFLQVGDRSSGRLSQPFWAHVSLVPAVSSWC